jgi:hypothetical protein
MKKDNKIVVKPLIISICFVVVLQILNRVLPPLMQSTVADIVGFFTTFGTILLGGAFFLAFVAANVNGKIPRRLHTIVELIIIFFIVVGVVCMFQPVAIDAYSTGFNILMFALLAFIVWSHLMPKLQSQEAEEAEAEAEQAGQRA